MQLIMTKFLFYKLHDDVFPYFVYCIIHDISTLYFIPLLGISWYIYTVFHLCIIWSTFLYWYLLGISWYISTLCIIPVWYDLPSRIAVKGAPSSCWSRISFNAITWLVNLKGKRLLWIFSVCINVVCIKWLTGFLEMGLTIKH